MWRSRLMIAANDLSVPKIVDEVLEMPRAISSAQGGIVAVAGGDQNLPT